MNKGIKLFGLATAICATVVTGFVGSKAIASSEISTKVDLVYVSKYVWRGLVANPDGAIQPSVTFSHPNGVSFNLWGSYDTTNISRNKNSFTEHDYTLNYSWSADKLVWNAGYIYYAFPNTSFSSTSEIYTSVTLPAALSPTIALNYDFDEAEGLYGSVSGSYNLPVAFGSSASSVSLNGKFGFSSSKYNKFYFGKDKNALADVVLSASMPFSVGKLTITPAVSYSVLVDDSLRDAVAKPDNFIASLMLSIGL